MFFANRNTQKNMQLLDKIHTVFTAALTDRASTIPSNIRGCQSGTWSQRGTKVNRSHHGATRYSDQQGSKSRQKVMRLYTRWHRPISKRFIKPPLIHIESSLDRLDGTVEPISRDQILRREHGQRNINFPCSADHEQDWQPYLPG